MFGLQLEHLVVYRLCWCQLPDVLQCETLFKLGLCLRCWEIAGSRLRLREIS